MLLPVASVVVNLKFPNKPASVLSLSNGKWSQRHTEVNISLDLLGLENAICLFRTGINETSTGSFSAPQKNKL